MGSDIGLRRWFPSSASADHIDGIAQSQFLLIARPSDAMNCGMAKEDSVSKAFRRLSEGAGREAATPPIGNRLTDLVSFVLWTLALALVSLGIFALFEGWLLPDG
jgi:hypothetical protein